MERIIGPRRSGKTTKAIECVAKDEHRVLVCPTHHMARYAERLAKEKGFEHIRCISFNTFFEYTRNHPTNNKYEFVIDELDACLEMANVIAYTNEDDEGEHRHGLYDYASSELKRAFPDESDPLQQLANKDILELIKVFSEQGHSGMSAPYVLSYFDRLVRFKPLGPLTGEDDEWIPRGRSETNGPRTYQNRRLYSLFKSVYDDGHVEYDDVEAYECMNVNEHIPYFGGGSGKIFREFFPIKFPYTPPEKKYRIMTTTVLSDPANGDFDTTAYIKIIAPDGTETRIDRYFGETEDGWKEIDWDEFEKRLEMQRKWQKEEKEKNQNGSI